MPSTLTRSCSVAHWPSVVSVITTIAVFMGCGAKCRMKQRLEASLEQKLLPRSLRQSNKGFVCFGSDRYRHYGALSENEQGVLGRDEVTANQPQDGGQI